MRNELKRLGNKQRYSFIGQFERVGYKNSYRTFAPTLLLKNVKLAETGQLITDHLWFNYTKGFLKLGELQKDDLITFDARVDDYYKGYIMEKNKDFYITQSAI